MPSKNHGPESYFYSDIDPDKYKAVIMEAKTIAKESSQPLYLLTKPLTDQKYSYSYNNMCALFYPKHKIIFINFADNNDEFPLFISDFLEDLGSLADKYNYRNLIGRPRDWERTIISRCDSQEITSLRDLISKNAITEPNLARKVSLVISLAVGSINDVNRKGIDEPSSLLEKVKRKIILFDGDQTRFLYNAEPKKRTAIQGLSGTGKTELLLHKIKDLYVTSEDNRIFFTCHNKILADNIRQRLPDFFDFMKVEKQIQWNERIWVANAWGSKNNKDSGLYRYLCDFYDMPFLSLRDGSFSDVCKAAIKFIEEMPEEKFSPALDYILIDESQDFSKAFFDLCEMVAAKGLYIAGDIFQNIFDTNIASRIINVDYILNKCYRTDPKTLMFAQSLGMGLFEKTKINWLNKQEWEACGYSLQEKQDVITLTRSPVYRFDDLELEDTVSIIKSGRDPEKISRDVIRIISDLKNRYHDMEPDDIAVILTDDTKNIYIIADTIQADIIQTFGWPINKGFESKKKTVSELFISNRNNVKGLEFSFVICITSRIIDDLSYRNTLYTMLSRSFVESFLVVSDDSHLDEIRSGLKTINNKRAIITKKPSPEELEKIKKTIINYKERRISQQELIEKVLKYLNVDRRYWSKYKEALRIMTGKDKYPDESELEKFILSSRSLIERDADV